MKHRLLNSIGFVAAAAFALASASAAGQVTTANGPYYATPSWDQTLPVSTRFIVLSNFNNQAVLDRDTGLVWERSPSSGAAFGQASASIICWRKTTGGRQGWRLPRAEELTSLADPSNTTIDQVHLPAGHPFINPTAFYGAADKPTATVGIWVTFLDTFGGTPGARVEFENLDDQFRSEWCVRSAQGGS